jgi:hypothetical protein
MKECKKNFTRFELLRKKRIAELTAEILEILRPTTAEDIRAQFEVIKQQELTKSN